MRKVFADRICDTVRNRCKKPQAVQAEQTKRVKEYVYSIMAMKTKDLHTNVTAKYPPRRAKPCICDSTPLLRSRVHARANDENDGRRTQGWRTKAEAKVEIPRWRRRRGTTEKTTTGEDKGEDNKEKTTRRRDNSEATKGERRSDDEGGDDDGDDAWGRNRAARIDDITLITISSSSLR